MVHITLPDCDKAFTHWLPNPLSFDANSLTLPLLKPRQKHQPHSKTNRYPDPCRISHAEMCEPPEDLRNLAQKQINLAPTSSLHPTIRSTAIPKSGIKLCCSYSAEEPGGLRPTYTLSWLQESMMRAFCQYVVLKAAQDSSYSQCRSL